jgi:HD superfamily phosphodiesterase
VAHLALRLAEEMDLDADARGWVCFAGALHDIGAFSQDERLDLLAFEETRPMQHAEAGHLLVHNFEALNRVRAEAQAAAVREDQAFRAKAPPPGIGEVWRPFPGAPRAVTRPWW